MLYWALVFFVLALVLAVLGFGVLSSAAATVAKVLFWVLVALFVIWLIAGLAGGGRRSPVT